jgi:ketose-bisphosphate aldolase
MYLTSLGKRMKLYNLKDLYLKHPKNAIAAINVSNMETTMAVLETAEKLNEAVILQVSPMQIYSQKISYKIIVKLIKLLGENYNVDVAIHLDHADSYLECKKAIDSGFTSVMFDGSTITYQENVDISRQIVEYARKFNVTVEAELGKVGGTEGKAGENQEMFLTKVSEVKDFISKTDVDLLAVAIGNAHGFYKGIPNIRIDRLKEINAVTNIPLVLHGGTGISNDMLIQCIDNGIKKVNIFTEADSAFVSTFNNEVLKEPRIYMMKVIELSRQAMMKVVDKKIRTISKGEK